MSTDPDSKDYLMNDFTTAEAQDRFDHEVYMRTRDNLPDTEAIAASPGMQEWVATFGTMTADEQLVASAVVLQVLTAHCGRTAVAKGFHDPEVQQTVDRRLLLAVGELIEAQDEMRNGHTIDSVRVRADGKPEGFVMELADTVVRVLDLAYAEGLDVGTAIIAKMLFNMTREHRHGKAF